MHPPSDVVPQPSHAPPVGPVGPAGPVVGLLVNENEEEWVLISTDFDTTDPAERRRTAPPPRRATDTSEPESFEGTELQVLKR